MKNCYLAPINLAYKYTSRLSEKNRNIMMYVSVTMIVLSCYYYQIDDYIGHICPAIINAIFGMLMFGILLLSGIDRRIDRIEIKVIPVTLVVFCGIIITISGIHHFIGYSYVLMGIFMFLFMPYYIVIFGENEHIGRLFKCLAIVLTISFAIFFIIHSLIGPLNKGEYYLAGRYMGMSFNPNGIAKTAVIGSISSLYLGITSRSKLGYLSSIVFSMGISMLWITQSRANVIAIALAVFFTVCICIRNLVYSSVRTTLLKRAVIYLAIVVILFPICKTTLEKTANRPIHASKTVSERHIDENQSDEAKNIVRSENAAGEGSLSDRFKRGNTADGNIDFQSLSSGRLYMWQRVIKEASILGHDMKTYKYHEYSWVTVEHAHNTVIEILARSGIFAGLSFLLLEVFCAGWVLKVTFSKKRKTDAETFAVLGVTAFGIASLFDIVVLPFAKMTVLVFYISFALLCSKRKDTIS